MQFFDPNNPNEKKKMIVAGVLALVAILVLGYVFFGGSSTSRPPANGNLTARTSPTPVRSQRQTGVEPAVDDGSIYREVVYDRVVPAVGDADRNIFAYYEAPSPTPKLVIIQTPTPTPTPPMTASSLSPSQVYAGTPADFTLQLNGDKFTPAVRVYFDGRDLPTRFINAQQLFATVSQTLYRNAGVHTVIVRNPDGSLYSNPLSLNVAQPTQPNFTYVGIIGKPHFNDTAVLQEKTSKDVIRVQRGDAVGVRFKVLSISEKEVILIDSTLKIQFKLAFTADQNSNSGYRPPARSVDDEP